MSVSCLESIGFCDKFVVDTIERVGLSGGAAGRIVAGRHHTCAIKTDGTVQCWGNDYSGQNTVPADLGTVLQITTDGLYLGGYLGHTCAIKANDSVQCWGSDSSGQSTVPADFQ